MRVPQNGLPASFRKVIAFVFAPPLSALLVPVNAVDSDHSTGWTYRGRFSGDNAAGP
jgi:hypothetical protein